MGVWRGCEAVHVPADVLRAIRRAQAANGVNEYSTFEVMDSARRLGETAALSWLVDNPFCYLHGVYHGFAEEPQSRTPQSPH